MKKFLSDIETDFRMKRIQRGRYYKNQHEVNPEWSGLISEISQRDFKELDIHFPRILYGSCMVASFTIFETMFKRICVLAAHIYSQEVPPDLTTGSIKGCRSYVASTLRIDISEVRDHWKKLENYRAIRNDMVHHNGVITKETMPKIKFLKGMKYVKVRKVRNKDQFIVFIQERGFIFDFLDCAAQFIFHILSKLPKHKMKTLGHL